MPEQKILLFRGEVFNNDGGLELLQKKVNRAIERLGAGWKITNISLSSSSVAALDGNVNVISQLAVVVEKSA